MESGVAVKKLHNMNENEFDGKHNPVHNAKVTPQEAKEANEVAKQIWGNTVNAKFHSIDGLKGKHFWVTTGSPVNKTNYLCKERSGQWTYSVGEGEHSRWVAFKSDVNEESSSGGAGAYSTPAWGTKHKGGSKRALDVTTKMGYKKVKDID
jgi:hypothetical protein